MGEAAGLVSAMEAAVTTILMRSQAGKYKVWEMSAIMGLFLSLFYLIVIVAFRQVDDLWRASGMALAIGLVSGAFGYVLGNSTYIKALQYAGVSRAFPVSRGAYVLFTLAAGLLVFNEAITLVTAAGVFLAFVGMFALTRPEQTNGSAGVRTTSKVKLGLLLAAAQGMVATVVTLSIRVLLDEMSVIPLNALRMPVGAFAMLAISFMTPGSFKIMRHGPKNLAVLAFIGFIGMGTGSLLFVYAVQEAGVAKTAILSTTSPLFALPLTALFLKEKVTRRILLGTVVTVLGIALIVL